MSQSTLRDPGIFQLLWLSLTNCPSVQFKLQGIQLLAGVHALIKASFGGRLLFELYLQARLIEGCSGFPALCNIKLEASKVYHLTHCCQTAVDY